MKHIFFLFLSLFSLNGFAQNSFSKHHYFNSGHRTRIVVNKKFNNISDSAFVSYELLAGNINAWNGDVYNQYPSIQFMTSYDNNKNFEIGFFGALTYSTIAGQNPNGFDVFSSWKLNQKLYLIFDIYTFLAKHDLLENSLGYNARIYNMYTAKFQLNATTKQTWFLGYSVLNDVFALQQTFFVEFDYNITKNIPVVLGFATNNNVLSAGLTNFYIGAGWLKVLQNKDNYAWKLTLAFNPVYVDPVYHYWPVTLLTGVEF